MEKSIQVIPVKYRSTDILRLIDEDTLFIYCSNSWHQDENSIGFPISEYKESLDRVFKILSQNNYHRIILEVGEADADDVPLFGWYGEDHMIRKYITDTIKDLDSSMRSAYGSSDKNLTCDESQYYRDTFEY